MKLYEIRTGHKAGDFSYYPTVVAVPDRAMAAAVGRALARQRGHSARDYETNFIGPLDAAQAAQVERNAAANLAMQLA